MLLKTKKYKPVWMWTKNSFQFSVFVCTCKNQVNFFFTGNQIIKTSLSIQHIYQTEKNAGYFKIMNRIVSPVFSFRRSNNSKLMTLHLINEEREKKKPVETATKRWLKSVTFDRKLLQWQLVPGCRCQQQQQQKLPSNLTLQNELRRASPTN